MVLGGSCFLLNIILRCVIYIVNIIKVFTLIRNFKIPQSSDMPSTSIMNLQTANIHDAFIIFELNFIKNRKNNIKHPQHISFAKSQENQEQTRNCKNRELLCYFFVVLLFLQIIQQN